MTFALFIVYVALSYIHPGEIVPDLAPYRITYWAGMASLGAAIVSLLGRRGDLLASLQLWGVIVFTAVMGVSLMFADRWLGAPVAAIERFGPALTIFVLAVCTVTSIVRLRIAAGCVIALTMMLMLQGAAAYHLGYGTRLFLTTGPDDPTAADDERTAFDPVDPPWLGLAADEEEGRDARRIRGLGFMHDPNDLSVGMIVALGLIVAAWKPSLRLGSLLLATSAGALVYGIYLTRSRGGAVALVVVLWRIAASRIGRIPALALLMSLAAVVLAIDFGGRSLSLDLDGSASERLVAWAEGLEMFKAEPLLGVGYGQFLDHHTLTAHNSFVLCLAETGFLGSFFWVGLFVVTLLELQQLKSLPGDEPLDCTTRRWAEGLQLALIGFLTAAFFLSRTFVPTLYLVFGLAAALAAIARNAGRAISLPPLPELGMLVLACQLGGIALVYTIVKVYAP